MNREDDGLLIKWYEQFGGLNVQEEGTEDEEVAKAKELEISPNGSPFKVFFIGLGAMGSGMAKSLQTAGFSVVGHDVNLQAMDQYRSSGGQATSDMIEGAKGAETVVLMPNTALQAEAILFGSEGQGGICTGEQ